MAVRFARTRRVAHRLALTLATFFTVSHAAADDPVRRAELLFREAKALTDGGHYPPACPKLEESERLDPALGTEFNLADCYEHVGRPADAYTLFRSVAEAAHAAGKDARERAARSRSAALEAHVAKVRIVFATDTPPAGAQILLDERAVRDIDSVHVVAPGHHVVEVDAVSTEPWKKSLDLDAGQEVTVAVPDLVPARPAVASPPNTPPGLAPTRPDDAASRAAPTSTSGARVTAMVLGGSALVGLAVGGVAGGLSISFHHRAAASCPVASACGNVDATNDWTSATTAGNVSTIGFISGGALAVGAIVMWLAFPSTAKSTRVSNACGAGGCSLRVEF